MLLIGLGIGALASQLGAVTVSAVPDDQSPEVGGIQNTMTNLGASMGTALAGSIMIAARRRRRSSPSIEQSSAIPARVKEQAQVELAGGVPFISDADLQAALDDAHVSRRTTDAALDAYGRRGSTAFASALAILALLDLLALFLAQRIPTTPVGERPNSVPCAAGALGRCGSTGSSQPTCRSRLVRARRSCHPPRGTVSGRHRGKGLT